MEVKTKELKGAALDYAVFMCEGKEHFYSSSWTHGGVIIERERISIQCRPSSEGWDASPHKNRYTVSGRTPLTAAMRCYVASKLGDTIEIPEELL